MSTKNIIISLVGLAIIVGATLFVFRYEYVVVPSTLVPGYSRLPINYIVRFDRFTLDACYVEIDMAIYRVNSGPKFIVDPCE